MKAKLPQKGKMPFYDVEDLASATECTGLIPSGLQTEAEAENYAQLYAIHSQKTNDPSGEGTKPSPHR